MFRNTRFMGLMLWLFTFQLFAATSGGLLAKYLWLDIGSGLVMFMIACALLGHSLPGKSDLALLCMFVLILGASILLTARICDQVSWRWYDVMTAVAAPQVMALAISFALAQRSYLRQPGTT